MGLTENLIFLELHKGLGIEKQSLHTETQGFSSFFLSAVGVLFHLYIYIIYSKYIPSTIVTLEIAPGSGLFPFLIA